MSRTDAEPKETLVTQIENLAWFHNSYKLDPTVSAMLNMLDRIQELYISKTCNNLFANLEKLRFYILPLSNFDLTEDLYVKMNARGKQLTSFENFKADLQHWIKDNAQKLGFADKNYVGRSMPYQVSHHRHKRKRKCIEKYAYVGSSCSFSNQRMVCYGR